MASTAPTAGPMPPPGIGGLFLVFAVVVGAAGYIAFSGDSPSGDAFDPLARGVALLEAGDRDGAVREFEAVLERQPTNAGAQLQLAWIASSEGRQAEAESRLRAAVTGDPKHAEAWTSLGTLLLLTERGPEAAQCFEKAIAADPRYPTARLYYGQMLEDAGTLAKARNQYEAARHADPGTPLYGLLEARLLWKMFKPALSQTLLAKVERDAARPLDEREKKLRIEIEENLEIWPLGPPPEQLPPDPEHITPDQPAAGS